MLVVFRSADLYTSLVMPTDHLYSFVHAGKASVSRGHGK